MQCEEVAKVFSFLFILVNSAIIHFNKKKDSRNAELLINTSKMGMIVNSSVGQQMEETWREQVS